MASVMDMRMQPSPSEPTHATAEELAVELIRLAVRLRRAGDEAKATTVEQRAESWLVRATLLREESDT